MGLPLNMFLLFFLSWHFFYYLTWDIILGCDDTEVWFLEVLSIWCISLHIIFQHMYLYDYLRIAYLLIVYKET